MNQVKWQIQQSEFFSGNCYCLFHEELLGINPAFVNVAEQLTAK